MQQALDNKDRLVNVSEAASGKSYKCPTCGGILRVRGGTVYRSHFYHVTNSNKIVSVSESNIHKVGKRLLKGYLIQHNYQVEEEYYFPNIGRRADLYSEKEQNKIVFEYQCSPLSEVEFNARNTQYKLVVDKVQWVLGKRYMIQDHLSSTHTKFISFNERFHFYLIFLNTENSEIIIAHEIKETGNKIKYTESTWNMERKCWVNHLLKYPTIRQFNLDFKLGILDQTTIEMQSKCYALRRNIRNAPSWCFDETFFAPIFKKEFWEIAIQMLLKMTYRTKMSQAELLMNWEKLEELKCGFMKKYVKYRNQRLLRFLELAKKNNALTRKDDTYYFNMNKTWPKSY